MNKMNEFAAEDAREFNRKRIGLRTALLACTSCKILVHMGLMDNTIDEDMAETFLCFSCWKKKENE